MEARDRKRSRRATAGRVIVVFTLWALFGLLVRVAITALAAEPATPAFDRTWARTDNPVAAGLVERTWMWGPEGFTGPLTEPYAEAPGGERTVQYFDKSRMEDNGYRALTPWDVTNGLLVVELISGRLQLGDDEFEQHAPAQANVAGDQDVDGVSYAELAALRDAPPLPDGATITARLDADGNVSDDPATASYGVTAAFRVTVPGIDHQVASPFWAFMDSSGEVYEGGAYITAPLFPAAFYATGLPLTEAYWASVKVAGTYQDVLLQCFERRCLTYTPANEPGWQVEAGNVGQHYYQWRYGELPDDSQPGEDPDPTPSPTATATEPGDGAPSPEPTTPPAAPPEEPTEEPYAYFTKWGQQFDPQTALRAPHAVAVSPDGSLYIGDWGNDRVQKYSPDGVLLDMFESDAPVDIAVDSAGYVYVADADANRVRKFDPAGNLLGTIGEPGIGPGQLAGLRGIAVDGDGYLYAAEGDSVQVFDSAGAWVESWKVIPADVAIVADVGYVLDRVNGRVQMFATDGTDLGYWGEGSFDTLTSIAASRDGTLYIVNTLCAQCSPQAGLEARVLVFDSDGTPLGQWGISGSETGQFYSAKGIAVDGSGDVFIADYDNDRVQKFGPDGAYLDSWEDGHRGRLTQYSFGIEQGHGGSVYVTDASLGRIQVFSSGGDFRYEFGEPGMGPGQLNSINDIAFAPDRSAIYVVDARPGRIHKFHADGAYDTEFGSAQLGIPTAVALDSDGNLYVTDHDDNRVHVFSPGGSHLRSWGGLGSSDGKFDGLFGIAVYDDRVYVSDFNNHRIQVFDLDGAYLGQWGSPGEGDGEFAGPTNLNVDRDGNVLVADSGNFRIQKFSPAGDFLTAFGSEGSGNGEFSGQVAATIAPDSSVYVLDPLNYRVQVFGQPSQFR